VVTWCERVIGDFETDAPPKSSLKKKKDAQPTLEQLGDYMDRSCLHVWLMSNDATSLRVAKLLTGVKLEKYKQMWNKGSRATKQSCERGQGGPRI
jgi:hypothetical protein